MLEGHRVHVFKIPSHGDTEADSGNSDTLLRQEFGKIGGCRFTFRGRICSQDNLLDLFLFKAREQVTYFEIFRADTVMRG